MKTLQEQLKCAKRELALRKNTYPKWIESGKMDASNALHEMSCMESIVHTLERQATLEEVSKEMVSKLAPTSDVKGSPESR